MASLMGGRQKLLHTPSSPSLRTGFAQKHCTAAAFIDIQSAFDSAWPTAIVDALAKRHCPVYLAKIIKSFLENRRAKFQCHVSVYDVEMGCPQGSVLSPFLWAILIDDALHTNFQFKNITVAFADDITLGTSNADPEEALADLQTMCDWIISWLACRKLNISAKKSVLLFFSRRPKILASCTKLTLSLCGSTIRCSNQTRFLGYLLDPRLSWLPHIESRCIAAKIIIFSCRRFLGLTWGLDRDRLKILYAAIVEPTLLYGCSLWCMTSRGKRTVSRLGSVQRLFNIMLVRALSTTSSISLNLLTMHIPTDYRIIELTISAECRIPPHSFSPSSARTINEIQSLIPPISTDHSSLLHLNNHPPWY